MAEMTAQEAKIFIAQELKKLSGPEGCCVQTMQRNQAKRNNLRGIAALIEQQQQQIEQLQGQATFDSSQLAEYETMIREMANKIEQLKCCGNCNSWIMEENGCWQEQSTVKWKCDKWQGVE